LNHKYAVNLKEVDKKQFFIEHADDDGTIAFNHGQKER